MALVAVCLLLGPAILPTGGGPTHRFGIRRTKSGAHPCSYEEDKSYTPDLPSRVGPTNLDSRLWRGRFAVKWLVYCDAHRESAPAGWPAVAP